ncbi:unnamed protein product [Schistocephalus solidus]|uniref:DDE_Tnp_IS1595 domain-containing protein n=1 Tax=Schistocephalus solidus TaxID=70667 RepID=A0A183SD02_SCHSO|nr:unnamed protein product [Schistocephalus solidus]
MDAAIESELRRLVRWDVEGYARVARSGVSASITARYLSDGKVDLVDGRDQNPTARYATAEENAGDPVRNYRKYGPRIDAPWVLGLCQGTDVRYFYIQKRDADTFITIIEREVEAGSIIPYDEWPAYRRLNQVGYDHKTANHQESYVDPNTGESRGLIQATILNF